MEKKPDLKYIAFYLPQFHPIPENNEWWGEGFTEWTNTKKAVPLFEGQRQPREPLNGYYYDLRNVSAHEWQSRLMQKYNVYGLCYYHYWFSGKMLLEKPAELLGQHKEIDTHFCFSWANEPWTRNWDGWDYAVLMPQEYGGEEDWERHFAYLLPFFKDDRYIKVNGKPLFVLYASAAIDRCGEMIEYWRRLAKKNGLSGLFVAETLNSKPNQNFPYLDNSDACIEFEPTLTLFGGYTPWNAQRFLDTLHVFEYEKVWEAMLKRKSSYGSREKFCGAFVDWDNSPRVAKKASVCLGADPERFKVNLKRLTQKCMEEGNDRFIFINAWNEWAEGAYLEPDMHHGLGYLEAIRDVSDEFGLTNG